MYVYYYLAWRGVNCVQDDDDGSKSDVLREVPRSWIFLWPVYEDVWGKLVPYIDWYGPSLHADVLDVSRRGVEEELRDVDCRLGQLRHCVGFTFICERREGKKVR